MIKKKEKTNTLIKYNNLIIKLKKEGIKRASKDSLVLLDKYLINNLKRLIPLLNEEMIVHGRKTLMKEDILEVLNKLKKEEKGWEV